MKTFTHYINGIAERKILSRGLQSKTPNLTYYGLSTVEQNALTQILLSEDDEVRELIASKISNAIEDAYCDMLRPSEAIDDAIDLARFKQEDEAQRARDMNQALKAA